MQRELVRAVHVGPTSTVDSPNRWLWASTPLRALNLSFYEQRRSPSMFARRQCQLAASETGGKCLSVGRPVSVPERVCRLPSFGGRRTMQAWRRLDIAVRYRIADALFSGLVVTPLAVLYSYGTGAIIRRVSTDHAPLVTSFLLFCAAVGVQFAAGYRQRDIAAWFSRQPELYAEAAKRVYIFVYALSNVCHYTALNTLFDIYVESDKDGRFHAALELLASTIIVLAGLRCCRNVMGLPLHVAIDTESTASVIETTTIFGVQVRSQY